VILVHILFLVFSVQTSDIFKWYRALRGFYETAEIPAKFPLVF